MTQTATHRRRHPPSRANVTGPALDRAGRGGRRVRLGLLGVLPFIFALPVIGVVLALARHPTMSVMPGRSPGGRVTPCSE